MHGRFKGFVLSPDSAQFKRGTGTRVFFSRFVSVGFRKFCVVCMIFETCMKQTLYLRFCFACALFQPNPNGNKQTAVDVKHSSSCEALH